MKRMNAAIMQIHQMESAWKKSKKSWMDILFSDDEVDPKKISAWKSFIEQTSNVASRGATAQSEATQFLNLLGYLFNAKTLDALPKELDSDKLKAVRNHIKKMNELIALWSQFIDGEILGEEQLKELIDNWIAVRDFSLLVAKEWVADQYKERAEIFQFKVATFLNANVMELYKVQAPTMQDLILARKESPETLPNILALSVAIKNLIGNPSQATFSAFISAFGKNIKVVNDSANDDANKQVQYLANSTLNQVKNFFANPDLQLSHDKEHASAYYKSLVEFKIEHANFIRECQKEDFLKKNKINSKFLRKFIEIDMQGSRFFVDPFSESDVEHAEKIAKKITKIERSPVLSSIREVEKIHSSIIVLERQKAKLEKEIKKAQEKVEDKTSEAVDIQQDLKEIENLKELRDEIEKKIKNKKASKEKIEAEIKDKKEEVMNPSIRRAKIRGLHRMNDMYSSPAFHLLSQLKRIEDGHVLKDDVIRDYLRSMKADMEQRKWETSYGGGEIVAGLNAGKRVPKHVAQIYRELSKAIRSIDVEAAFDKMQSLASDGVKVANSTNYFWKRHESTKNFYHEFNKNLDEFNKKIAAGIDVGVSTNNINYADFERLNKRKR